MRGFFGPVRSARNSSAPRRREANPSDHPAPAGRTAAADLILKGLNGAIGSKRVTYDFARQMDGATEIKCSQFGDNIIVHM